MSPQVAKRPDMLVHEDEPYNAEPPRSALAEQSLTALDTFYVRSHGPIPSPGPDPGAWRLRVQGLVDAELELTVDALRDRFRPRPVVATLQCAGNRRSGLMAVRDIPGESPWGPGATGTGEWTGVSLGDVLRAAGVRDGAAHVEFIGADVSQEASPPQPFGGSIPLSKAMRDEVLLAWAMNGEPLPALHGGPLRMIIPGYIGARSVKWVEQVVVRAQPSENFFYASAYRLLPADGSDDGFPLGLVAVNCDFLAPADGAVLPPGPVEVEGYAFAGGERWVARVDLSLDGGRTWSRPELLDPPNPWAWRRWRTSVDLPGAGEVELIARAWDSAAATQPSDPAQVWNPKGYANNAWARLRVRVA